MMLANHRVTEHHSTLTLAFWTLHKIPRESTGRTSSESQSRPLLHLSTTFSIRPNKTQNSFQPRTCFLLHPSGPFFFFFRGVVCDEMQTNGLQRRWLHRGIWFLSRGSEVMFSPGLGERCSASPAPQCPAHKFYFLYSAWIYR